MRAILASLAIALMAMCAPAGSFAASEQTVDIDLPDGYHIEKNTDVSAALLSRLFGNTWHEIVGDKSTESAVSSATSGSTVQKNAKDGLGMYSGLIVSILGVLNLAAMAYVSVAIIYMWGIFAVTTAHEGQKLGGSLYNSLWVPVRHACSFSLTVPILNGLSLMQVAIMACVALSINFANKVWDASGDYIVKHAHVGIIDATSPMLETEAYALVPVLFADSVIALVEANADNKQKKPDSLAYESYEDVDTFVLGTVPNSSEQLEGYVKYNHRTGEAIMGILPPESMDMESFGVVQFAYPKKNCAQNNYDGRFYCTDVKGDDRTAYDMKVDLAKIRIQQTQLLWTKLNAIAVRYLQSYSSGGNKSCVFPSGSGSGASCQPALNQQAVSQEVANYVRDFLVNVTKNSESKVQSLLSKVKDGHNTTVQEAIEKAIDSKNGKSRYGWVSAGLFTFSLSSVQQKIDDQVMTRISVNYPKMAGDLIEAKEGWWSKFMNRNYTEPQKAALQNLDQFIASDLLSNERYAASALVNNEGIYGKMGEWLLAAFVGNTTINRGDNGRTAGILGTVLNELGTYDPMVVMSSFGHRLLSLMNWATATTAIVAATFGNMLIVMALAFIVMTGAVFSYIVPITPVIFWMKALLSWLYLVVEAMVAAPFWCCSHALPEGAGFAGQHAKRGYLMLLDIVIRPTLLVIGAVFAVAIIQACGWMFNVIFNSWFANITGTFIQIGIIADVAFSIVVMSTMYYVSFTVFTKGVNYLPEKVVQWCGGMGGAGMRNEEHALGQVLAAGGAMGMARGGMQHLGEGAGSVGRGLGKGAAYGARKLGSKLNLGSNKGQGQISAGS